LKSGIYYIKNKLNGKLYIGQGLDVHKRMKQYHYNSWALLKAINKYGENNFEYGIVCYCSENDLMELEIYYIKKLNTVVPNGYNISWGGHSPMKDRKHSSKTKKQMKDSHADVLGDKNPMFGKLLEKKKSKYFGVYFVKQKNKEKWVSRVTRYKKSHYIGIYDEEIDSAIAYDNYIIENKLPNRLNFPEKRIERIDKT